MSSAKRSVIRSSFPGLLACILASTVGTAQQIVKWTDANGQVQYSDQAPAAQSSEAVKIPKSPPPPPAPPRTPRSTVSPENQALAELGKKQNAEWEANYRRKVEQQKAIEAATRQKMDQQIVDRCKANREIYCNKGAEAIRMEEMFRAAQREHDARAQ